MDLAQYRFAHPIALRFSDVDALQHVNNAKFITYMETARMAYFREVIGWRGALDELSVIIARIECDYLLPVELGDTVTVHLRTSRLGNKSWDFEYAITKQTGGEPPRVAARGLTVQVAFDYRQNASITIPDGWREKMLAFEPALEG